MYYSGWNDNFARYIPVELRAGSRQKFFIDTRATSNPEERNMIFIKNIY